MANLNMQRSVSGIDVFNEPQNLPPSRCAQLDNLICYAGVPKSRPGLQGLFTTPLTKPIWEQMPYVNQDKSTTIFFVSGGDTDGQLYQTEKGASTYTAATGTPTNINAPLARLDRAGSRGYLVDRKNPLVSFDVTNGASAYVAEDPPANAPSPVVLTNEILEDFSHSGEWVCDTFDTYTSGDSLIPDSQSDIDASGYDGDPGDGVAIGTTWVTVGTAGIHEAGSGKDIPSDYSGVALRWFSLDDPLEGFHTGMGADALQNPSLAHPNEDRYGTQFYFRANYHTTDTRSLQGVKIIVDVYSDAHTTDATTQITRGVYTYILPYAGQGPGQYFDHVFSFPNLDSEIKSVVLTVVGADGNTNAAQFPNWAAFPAVANIVFAPIDNGVTLLQGTNQFTFVHKEPSTAYYGALGGIRLTKTYGADQNWSGKSTIAIALAAAGSNTLGQLVDGGMLFKLGFRTNGAPGTHQYSNFLTFADDYSYMYVDITTVDTATIAAFRYLEIVSLSDITVTATTNPLMKFGPLTFSGNLGLGLPYYWVFTEVKRNTGDTNFTNIIESEASPLTVTLTPTGLQAEASIKIPLATNSASTTHFFLYRFGGVFAGTDGAFPLARLIAIMEVGSNTIDQAFSPGYGNVTWAYDNVTFGGTVIDSTPDSALFLVPTLITGKTPPPLAPACQAEWLGRLWLGGQKITDDTYNGSILAGSWLLTASDAGVYFGPTQDPINDPSAAIKGFYTTVGGADNDDILALIPYGTVLLVVKERSVWMVTGTDGSNFELSGHMQRAGMGITGGRGWANVLNRVWLMTSTGPYRYDSGEDVTQMGQEIEPYIAPQVFGGEKIPGLKMQYASMLFAGKRVYLFAPSSSTSQANDACYVFDTRDNNQGWVRWPWAFGGSTFKVTSGITTAQLADDDEIFLGGYDGQLYELTGEYDLSKPGGTQSAITTHYLSRGMGQEQDDESYWATNIPSVVKASVQCAVDTTFTTTVKGAGNSVTDSHTFLLDQRGPYTIRFPDVSQAAQGDYLQVGVSTSSLGSVTIRAVAVEATEGDVSG